MLTFSQFNTNLNFHFRQFITNFYSNFYFSQFNNFVVRVNVECRLISWLHGYSMLYYAKKQLSTIVTSYIFYIVCMKGKQPFEARLNGEKVFVTQTFVITFCQNFCSFHLYKRTSLFLSTQNFPLFASTAFFHVYPCGTRNDGWDQWSNIMHLFSCLYTLLVNLTCCTLGSI